MKSTFALSMLLGATSLGMLTVALIPDESAQAQESEAKPAAEAKITKEWPQWGGDSARNNVPIATGIPTSWDIGGFDRSTGQWLKEDSENIKWVAGLGSQSYGNPVIADGKIFVGTNNGSGYIDRYPTKVDAGCLVCFDESTGEFLWQHTSEKLPTGFVHDWPLQGICSTAYVEGDRLWFVTSRGEVRCLDTNGFHDDENDGPYTDEEYTGKKEADVVWVFNMMKEMEVSQHNMCSCSITALGDILFVNTSNGVDESHLVIPSVDAPSFFAMDKNTGQVYWTDNSPGANILHGQWSSPTVGVLGGVPQVIFAAGDGWVYSYKADKGTDGKPELLWKFDANPKTTKWVIGGRGTRNNIISTPVIYDGKVYVAVGQDPEHGEGPGRLWCLDPTKRGDVSNELAMKIEGSKRVPIEPRRIQAVIEEDGEVAVPNPNSAVIWQYAGTDVDGDGDFSYEETMHRSIGTVTIKNDILFIADYSGLVHCLNAQTGKRNWVYDMFACAWGSALIVEDNVYIGDEEGDVCVFKLSADESAADPIEEINMGNSVFSTPVVANGVLYIANKSHLFAITKDGK